MVTETKSRGSVSRFASLSTLKREKCETSYEKRNFSSKSQGPRVDFYICSNIEAEKHTRAL